MQKSQKYALLVALITELAFLRGAQAQVALVADPPSLKINNYAYSPAQCLQLTASDGRVPNTIPYAVAYNAISPPGNWLQAVTGGPVSNSPNAPVQICAKFVYPSAPPGSYSGNLTITSSIAPALVVPVMVTIYGAFVPPTGPPSVAGILNAASFASGSLSPGEIISIFGANLGPPPGTQAPVNGGSTVIFFNGALSEYFAPITYSSDTQINCVVPYEVANWGQAYLQVGYVGGWYTTNNPNVQIIATAPGIFTAAATGTGQAAALNSDNTPNTTSNPASAGSAVQVWMTGEGQTSPPGITGSVTCSAGCATTGQIPKPLLPVTATVGGQPAAVSFYGEAPGLVAGVMQVNLVIPPNTPSGAVSLSITVGSSTQAGITIAVK
jgi:uncharacterized protein (TIGR03437 family)